MGMDQRRPCTPQPSSLCRCWLCPVGSVPDQSEQFIQDLADEGKPTGPALKFHDSVTHTYKLGLQSGADAFEIKPGRKQIKLIPLGAAEEACEPWRTLESCWFMVIATPLKLAPAGAVSPAPLNFK